METFLSQVVGTVTLRPYFVVFFLAYVIACSLHLGLMRTVLFAVGGFLCAWLAEYSSIHNGIPFGHYYYIEATRGRELWFLGVPFMDSMSFVFLSYASYTMALLTLSPLCKGTPIYLLENRQLRESGGVRLLGAFFFVYLDLIIDPVALKGHKWFLGQIYGYPSGGVYFGVPISNFMGWLVVGFVLISLLQAIDRLLHRWRVRDRTGWSYSWRYLPGPALYLGIIVFNLSVTFFIGEYHLGWAGVFIVFLPLALLAYLIHERMAAGSLAAAVSAHLADFPGAVLPGTGPVSRSRD